MPQRGAFILSIPRPKTKGPQAVLTHSITAPSLTLSQKNRSFNSCNPILSSISRSRSAGFLLGRSLYCAMISSFFIECSHPTSSVTLT